MAEAGAGLAVRLRQHIPAPLDLTFGCAPGEVLALVGPSGAGKSTALRCVAGLASPAEGRVACTGAVWLDRAAGVDVPPHRRAVGLVFQDYALFPHMTAEENVAAALGHRPRGERAVRARELLATVHLAGLEDRRPARLSGGQRQRVAVARALARDPAVLLLDEPFSAVDRVTRRRLQAELVALRRRLSLPVVLVTHDLEEAAMLADRMCVLHRGRGLQTAPPAEMLARPASAEVARLLDLRNLFRGVVEGHDGGAGATFLRWGGRVLEAAHAPSFAPGAAVDWLAPASHLVLHRRDRPSRGERENPVGGRVVELLRFGEAVQITLDVGDPDGGTLALSMPTHVAARNGLAEGVWATISILREGIHLMPQEGRSPTR